MRRFLSILLVAGFGLMSSACIGNDDMSGCPTGTETLKIFFTHQETDLELTSQDLQTAVVYVYNAGGEQQAVWTSENPEFDTTYDTGISLGAGPATRAAEAEAYTIVTWLNCEGPYSLSSPEHLSEAQLTLARDADGIVEGELPWLFYGNTDGVTGKETAAVEIPTQVDNYVISLSAFGLPEDGDEFQFKLEDSNGRYDFHNACPADNQNIYYRASKTYGSATTRATGDTDSLYMSLTTLRLDVGLDPQFTLTDTTTGTQVYPNAGTGISNNNLVNIIKGASADAGVKADFTSTHHYHIILTLTQKHAAIQIDLTDVETFDTTLTVNGWDVKEDNYVLDPDE